jgi:hypothetical protein
MSTYPIDKHTSLRHYLIGVYITTVMHELVKFLSLFIPLELCLDHFTTWIHQPGGINKASSLNI